MILVWVAGEERTRALRLWLDDVASTLMYQCHPLGRMSMARLQNLRGVARGGRCVIIGNGPSLNSMDLSLLRNVDTFALNRGYLLFKRIGAPTTYLVSVNEHVMAQSGEEMLAVPAAKFFSWRNRRHVHWPRRDVVFLRTTNRPYFSTDVGAQGVWEGATVTFVALQLAFHLGYRDIILIGVDHSFATTGQAHQLVTSTGTDPNHFDPSYFGAGYRWQLPDLETSEIAYRMAQVAFEEAGGSIVDATFCGKLQVFPKVDLADALGSKARRS